MSKKLILSILLALGVVAAAWADQPKVLQLGVFDPVQTVPAGQSIAGVRLALFYTLNKDVSGFSLTLIGLDKTTMDFKGVELSLVNWVGGSF